MAALADVVVPRAANRADFLAECRAGRFAGVVAAYHTFASGAQTGRLDAELLAALPASLRFVCHNGAGYDQIDVAACTARGIRVSHTPHAVDEATADLHLFLLLGALRNLGPVMASVRRGGWRGTPESTAGRSRDLLGHNPRGKILGVLGMGGIGRTVAAKAHAAFGMRVRYYNRRRLPPAVEQACGQAAYVSFDRLLAESDVLSVNVPLNAQTHHLLGAAEFARMKPGSVLVNTARGAVLDEAALAAALASGHLAAAGLDVFEHEPAVHPGLLANERVVLVPHMGTATVETEKEMEEMAMGNVRAAVEQGRLLNVVPEQAEAEEAEADETEEAEQAM